MLNEKSTEKNWVINNLITTKRNARVNDRELDSVLYKIGVANREVKELNQIKEQRFVLKRAQEKLELFTQLKEGLLNERRDIQKKLANLMMIYDLFDSSIHEKAQLLSISHVAYQYFLDQNKTVDEIESLMISAFMHAEIYGQRDELIADRKARDFPLFNAASQYIFNATKDKINIQDFFDRPIPTYHRVAHADGSVEMRRNPPKLKVIRGQGSEHP